MRARLTRAAIVATACWLAAGLYVFQFALRGWVPHDEGTIAQSAERVLAGDLPHRDFEDVYTGGLSYFHAAGMKLFGVNLRIPRYMLFGSFMAFLAAVYAVARRLTSPTAAVAAMVLAAAWSVPNYFASLPSWYNLFLATFGVLALLRFLDGRHRGWLVAAGAIGGGSILFKIVGVYFVAGAAAFLFYLAQRPPGAPREPRSHSATWIIAALPAAGLTVVGLALVASGAITADHIPIVAPAWLVAAFLAWRERYESTGSVSSRLRELTRLTLPLATGVLVAVGPFVAWFWYQDALADLAYGVFVLPQRRLADAAMAPPALVTILPALPFGPVLLAGRRGPVRGERLLAAGLTGWLAAMLFAAGQPPIYQFLWTTCRALPLVIVIAGLWFLARRQTSGGVQDWNDPKIFLAVTMAAMVSLVQFPYAAPIYFCYAAPMAILATVGLATAQPDPPRWLYASVGAFLLAFGLIIANGSSVLTLGFAHVPARGNVLLTGDRGGLAVPAEDQDTYERLVNLLQHNVQGGTIYAGPDAPEVYFLAGFENPTRNLFEVLSPVRHDGRWMAGLADRAQIQAAVVNTTPHFSPALDPHAVAELERRFSTSVRVGRFLVYFDADRTPSLKRP